jgi:hypothetical protein
MANKLPKKFIRAIKAGKVKAHDDVDIKKLQKAIKERRTLRKSYTGSILCHRARTKSTWWHQGVRTFLDRKVGPGALL